MNQDENKIIVPNNNDLTLVDEMTKSSKQTYSSIKGSTLEEKKQLFNAMSKCDYRVVDKLGETILLKDLIIQKYDKVNEETGVLESKKRIILVDNEGKTYASASNGLFNSISRLFGILGTPDTWSEPIPIQVIETETKNKQKTYEIKTI